MTTRKVSDTQEKLNRIAKELAPVRREGLTTKLVRKLESLIKNGQISPGDRLPPERELSAMLGVSRASLREALKALQIMGVLGSRHGSGTYLMERAHEILSVPPRLLIPVRGITKAEMWEVRRTIEAEASAAAADRGVDADLTKIRNEFERMKATTNDESVCTKHDFAFHQAIAAASGNALYAALLNLINKVLFRAVPKLLKPPPKALEEHEQVVIAIEERSPYKARRAMLNHLTWETMMDNLTGHNSGRSRDEKTLLDFAFVTQAPLGRR